jgi:hypothetical protein
MEFLGTTVFCGMMILSGVVFRLLAQAIASVLSFLASMSNAV